MHTDADCDGGDGLERLMEGVPDWNLGYEILIAGGIALIFGLMAWLFASTRFDDDDEG